MFSVSALFYLDVRAARGRAGKDEVNSAGSHTHLLSFTIGLLDDEQAFSLGFSRTTVKGIDAFYLLTSGFLRVDRRADDLIF